MPPLKLIFITVALGLCGSFHLGYQLVVTNPSEASIREFFNQSFFLHYDHFLSLDEYNFSWPALVNLLTIGGFIGAFFIGLLLGKLGSKRCFYVVALIGAVGWICCGISYYVHSFECFAVGRFIAGVAASISLGVQPVYFTEISSMESRGLINSITGLLIQGGIFVASIVALPVVFGGRTLWPWLFWLELFLIVPALCLLPFLPESPKYLLAVKRDVLGAKNALRYFGRTNNIDQQIDEIQTEIKNGKSNVGLITILKTRYLRNGLFLGCSVVIAGQMSGISAISFFSTNIFIQAGLSPGVAPYATVGVTFSLALGAVVSSVIVDRFGRRPLLIISMVTMILCHVVFITFSQVGKRTGTSWPGYMCIVSMIVFNFIYSVGPGVLMFFVSAELMPEEARTMALSVATMAVWVSMAVSSGIFFPLSTAVGEWSFFIFIVPLLLVVIYLYFKLPETKNKGTEEIIKNLGYNKYAEETFV